MVTGLMVIRFGLPGGEGDDVSARFSSFMVYFNGSTGIYVSQTYLICVCPSKTLRISDTN